METKSIYLLYLFIYFLFIYYLEFELDESIQFIQHRMIKNVYSRQNLVLQGIIKNNKKCISLIKPFPLVLSI